MKKAQITVFVIIGLLMLFILALVLMLSRDTEVRIDKPTTLVDTYIESCMELKAEDIFVRLGNTGARFQEEVSGTAYLVKEKENLLPNLEVIEQNIITAINESLDDCINDCLNDNSMAFINITKGEPEFNIRHGENAVFIEILKPYIVHKQQLTYAKEIIPIEIKVRLKLIHEIVNNSIDNLLSEGYISENKVLQDDDFNIMIYDNTTHELWMVLDNGSKQYRKPYKFRFAVEK